jgi:flagellar hook assembly protein FlgD
MSVTGGNPFRTFTALSITADSQVRLRIYDMSGRTVVDSRTAPGRFSWDGRSSQGGIVPSGVYFAVASLGDEMATCRLVKI